MPGHRHAKGTAMTQEQPDVEQPRIETYETEDLVLDTVFTGEDGDSDIPF